MRLVPRFFRLAQVMLVIQGALCLLGAGFISGMAHSVAAAVVAMSILGAFGLAHIAVMAALRPRRRWACRGALALECFWVPAGLIMLLWPSGSQGYLEYFFLLLIGGSATSAISLLRGLSTGSEEPG